MLLSIVTVVKNNRSQIALTLQSILSQNFKNLELIIIDGISDDGTENIIRKHFKQFKLIRKKDNSVYESLNHACKIAKGDYVTFLHSGDIYFNSNVLSQAVKNFDKFDLISSNIIYFNDELKIPRIWISGKKEFNKKYFSFAHTSFFYSKKVFKNNFYDSKLKISADSKYLLQLSKKKISHKHLNLLSVCMYNKGLSTNINSFYIRLKEDLYYLKEQYKYLYFIKYLEKVLSKINSLILIKKKRNILLEGRLKKTIKFLETLLVKKKVGPSKYYVINQNINLVKNINKFLLNEKNFVLSALNLALLGSFFSGRVRLFNNMYFWPDGYLPLLITEKYKNIKKLAGRNMLRKLRLPSIMKKIHVCGNLTRSQKKYLSNRFKIKVLFTKIPYGTTYKLVKYFPKFKRNVLYIFTLPTPKQEELAEIISTKNKNYKIILIGGALNILTGLEKEVPRKFEYIESIWRLRFDTYHRLSRFIITGTQFIINYLTKDKQNYIFQIKYK